MRTEELLHYYPSAASDTVAERKEQESDGRRCTDGSERIGTDKTADYYRVGYVVYLLENITDQCGQREDEYVSDRAADRHISDVVFHDRSIL